MTSFLYKAIGKIYKKIAFKEKHWVFIFSEELAIELIKVQSHKPLPFSDSFNAEVIMKYEKKDNKVVL